MSNRQRYRELCRRVSLPLFSQDWWLDAVAGPDAWDAALVRDKTGIVASVPYVVRKVFPFRLLTMPRLTPRFHIWMDPPEGQKLSSFYSFEIRVLTELVEDLPRFDRFHQKYSYALTNWLPFYWRGYCATTRYSYVLPDLSDLDSVYSGFRENIRREIRKALRAVQVEVTDNVDTFLDLGEMTFSRQGLRPSYSRQLVRRVDLACAERDRRRILLARDNAGRLHAALYLVWDDESAYYLLGGSDPELRTSGAASLLMWEAIRFAAGVCGVFDFEGSMIEPVERFFRSFGAQRVPYFGITKNRHLFKLLNF